MGDIGKEFKSKYMLVFDKMDGDIGFVPCVSVLQNGWVTLDTLKII